MDRLQSMEAFVRVAELGSFAAAAKAMDLSRAMVSKHVAALEDRLGARLLQRTTRRLSLTEIGRAYFERARDVIGQVAEAEEAATALQTAPRGTLRLNVPTGFGMRQMSPALAARVTHAGIERRGVFGGQNGTLFPHLPEITTAVEAASDHAALFIDFA